MLRNPSCRSPASRIFDHLSEDERIDKACEILAHGVFLLAEKRGLLKKQKEDEAIPSDQTKEAV